ncbi:hypothetical protein BDK51DRAFT_26934 [Blyttiomyces helicus]|uniref:Uncharacterized protein n=1 Tax=Blyttiomyces helicus TaxID=388810 RepID=A0A4P9W8Q3_9FUNG|nr:hypothetical protein BDK51DRAFT_26934 [Blyttiomyces helicus]|eukprot:RKO87170.1 hypothetical protein BDK51DRAFT_26934 [Blyttiomyces helicus]
MQLGTFRGETQRLSEDGKYVSALDVIGMITGSRKPQKIWKELIRNQELEEFCTYVKFSGYNKTPTPSMNAKGLTKLLKVCKGVYLRAFSETAAKELVNRMSDNEQYFDSDWEDDDSEEEISKNTINGDHEPKSSKMQTRWIPSLNDQHVDKYYRNKFGEKLDVIHAALCTCKESKWKLHIKVGRTGTVRTFQKRLKEHAYEFDDFYLFFAMVVRDLLNVEKRFKETSFFQTYYECMETQTKTQRETLSVVGYVTSVKVTEIMKTCCQEGERLKEDGNEKLKKECVDYSNVKMKEFIKQHYELTTNRRDYVLFRDMNCFMRQKLKDVPERPKLKKVVLVFGGVPDKKLRTKDQHFRT